MEPRPSIYLCDLSPGLPEDELQELASRYGKVQHFEHLDEAGQESALVEYEDAADAQQAQQILNFSLVRGKTCRCLLVDSLEAVRGGMEAGQAQRLVIEQLDPGVDSRGLRDLCALFGEVLDSKVELDGDELSLGYGFVHFAQAEATTKAKELLSGMQVGASALQVRPYKPEDCTLFSGCLYASGHSLSSTSAGQKRPKPCERSEAAFAHFKSLKYNHIEVLEDREAKLERLKALIEVYDPNQDSQILIVALASELPAVRSVVGACCEQADFDVLDSSVPLARRREVAEGFECGNIYVLVVDSQVSVHPSFTLGASAAVLINFDLPPTLPQMQYRIWKRTKSTSRVHNFLVTSADQKIVMPLMVALEEMGQEMPPQLMQFWSDD